jgi:hypothetical protein
VLYCVCLQLSFCGWGWAITYHGSPSLLPATPPLPFPTQSKSGLNVKLIFDQLIQAVLSTSTDPTKGGGGGGVMGAGLKPTNVVVPEPRKKGPCSIL